MYFDILGPPAAPPGGGGSSQVPPIGGTVTSPPPIGGGSPTPLQGGTNPLQSALGATGNFFNALNAFMTDNSIDILYKTFAVIGVLFALYFIPATKKFTIYAALALLLILCIQSSPGYVSTGAPASSTLPLQTQIGSAVPPPNGSGGSSGGSGSGGGGSSWLSFLPIVASFFG